MAAGKVLVALSGGIDSSVTLALLKKQGYDCISVHMMFWNEPKAKNWSVLHGAKMPQNKCCTSEALEEARKVSSKFNVPFYVLNVSKPFKKHVVDYFLNVCGDCKTPNPCVMCNKYIKFGVLLKHAFSIGADAVATGHYVRKIGNSLYAAKDKTKDQSYFLWSLTQKQLKHCFFPLGNYLKKEVYALAKKFGFKYRKESQGLCFFPERTPEKFLERHLSKKHRKPGLVRTLDEKIIGDHKGLSFYTIGERRIGIGGSKEPLYVIRIDKNKNELVVGERNDLFRNSLFVSNLNFIFGKIPIGKINVQAKIRYRFEAAPAIFESRGLTSGVVKFKKPVYAVTPGQSIVFYDGKKMLGGGIII